MEEGYERPKDWRGNEIGVFTKVIWRQGSTSMGRWAIGRVTEVRKDDYGAWLLDVEWLEQSSKYGNQSGKARGVAPYNVTVFREGPN